MASKGLDWLESQANTDPLEQLSQAANSDPPKQAKKRNMVAASPLAPLGMEVLRGGLDIAHDVFGLLTLPYTAALKKPNEFEQDLRRGGMALGGSIPVGALGSMTPAGPAGGAALGNAFYTAMRSDKDQPLETLISAGMGFGIGKLLPAKASVSAAKEIKEAVEKGLDPAVVELTAAMKNVEPIRVQQEAARSLERGKRFVKAGSARREAGGGERGARAAVSQMGGELPKGSFTELRSKFTQEKVDRLYDIVGQSGLNEGDKLTAERGLGKLLGLNHTEIPQRNELEVLNTLFGREFTETALAKRGQMRSVGNYIAEAMNFPKSMLASYDLSGAGRQGLMMISRKEYWKNLAPMVKAFGSEKYYNASMQNITSRPTYSLMREAGLAIAEMGEVAGIREEAFQSRLAERIPVFGRGILASNRAYNGFLNNLRADVFDSFVRNASPEQIADPSFLRSAASFTNTFTGRGDLPKFMADWGSGLGTAMFSPRLQVARFNISNPVYYAKLHPEVRKEAVKTVLKSGSMLGTMLGLASLLPEVRLTVDPKSTDFGRLRYKNTHIDLTAGLQQPVRLGFQLWNAVTEGKIISANGKTLAKDGLEVLGDYIRTKISPIIGFTVDMLQGENAIGQPTTVTKTGLGRLVPNSKDIATRVVPLAWQDIWDALREYGGWGYAAAPPVMLGIGVQTYHRGVRPFKFDFSPGNEGGSVEVEISDDMIPQFAGDLDQADMEVAKRAAALPRWSETPQERKDALIKEWTMRYRREVQRKWIAANRDSVKSGKVKLTRPPSK